MAITVFARNFRGFRNLVVPLDLNIFLVGDNSSGKTSVIHLISYVLNTQLTQGYELDKRYSVGRYDFFSPYFDFDDVTIGYVNEEEDVVKVVLVTLRYVKGGRPKLVRFTSIKNNNGATYRIDDDDINLRVFDVEGDHEIEEIYKLHDIMVGYKKPFKKGRGSTISNASDIYSLMLENLAKIIGQNEKDSDLINSFKALVQEILPTTHHIGPLRGLPERFYPLDRSVKPSGAHFAAMWHDLKNEEGESSFGIVKKFGYESSLFDDIDIEKIAEKFEDSPLIVIVKKNGKEFLLNQVGIGVSQAIPILIESVYSQKFIEKNEAMVDYLLIQQPELHLHPVAQAAMGEFLFEMSACGPKYIVETHSDYIIDRYRAKIREAESCEKSHARIMYFENGVEGNSYHEISINPDGTLGSVPENYKSFFVKEFVRTMF